MREGPRGIRKGDGEEKATRSPLLAAYPLSLFFNAWMRWALIPVPVACEATALPFELRTLQKKRKRRRRKREQRKQFSTTSPNQKASWIDAQHRNYLLHPTPTGSQRRGQEALSASSRRPPLGGDGLYLRPAERTSVRRPTAIQSLNCDRASSRIKATALAADIPRGFAACYHTRGFRRGAWRASRRVIRRYRSPMAPRERDAAGFPGNLTVSPCFFTKSKTRARTFIRWKNSARSVDHQCRWFD